jgi:hypothetical protein
VTDDVLIVPTYIQQGVYEGHHLLCPIHGRQVAEGWSPRLGTPDDPNRAACGCQPIILWNPADQGEYNHRTDNMNLGRSRYV